MVLSARSNIPLRDTNNIYVYIYIYIYIYINLINWEYFNNLNGDGDIAGTSIMAGICTYLYPFPYPIEKFGDSPYPYLYLVNARIPHQNGDRLGQFPHRQVYLPSLSLIVIDFVISIMNWWLSIDLIELLFLISMSNKTDKSCSLFSGCVSSFYSLYFCLLLTLFHNNFNIIEVYILTIYFDCIN